LKRARRWTSPQTPRRADWAGTSNKLTNSKGPSEFQRKCLLFETGEVEKVKIWGCSRPSFFGGTVSTRLACMAPEWSASVSQPQEMPKAKAKNTAGQQCQPKVGSRTYKQKGRQAEIALRDAAYEGLDDAPIGAPAPGSAVRIQVSEPPHAPVLDMGARATVASEGAGGRKGHITCCEVTDLPEAGSPLLGSVYAGGASSKESNGERYMK
jgi:hypothetical protein